MKTKQIGFLDEENRLNKISKLGDPLEVPEKAIDWEMFRSVLTRACVRRAPKEVDVRHMMW